MEPKDKLGKNLVISILSTIIGGALLWFLTQFILIPIFAGPSDSKEPDQKLASEISYTESIVKSALESEESFSPSISPSPSIIPSSPPVSDNTKKNTEDGQNAPHVAQASPTPIIIYMTPKPTPRSTPAPISQPTSKPTHTPLPSLSPIPTCIPTPIPTPEPTPIRTISLYIPAVYLNIGEEKTSAYHNGTNTYPDLREGEVLRWESDNTDVVTVGTYGNLTAVNLGTANVTVSIDDTSTTFKVYVVNKSVPTEEQETSGRYRWSYRDGEYYYR